MLAALRNEKIVPESSSPFNSDHEVRSEMVLYGKKFIFIIPA